MAKHLEGDTIILSLPLPSQMTLDLFSNILVKVKES